MQARLVFISGNFFELHTGHFRLFSLAAEIGSRVVVGVNKIDSHNLEERVQALKTIGLIHEVLVIDPDLQTILSRLRPDVVLKGSEYRDAVNLESDLIEQWGGRILFASGETSVFPQRISDRISRHAERNVILSIPSEITEIPECARDSLRAVVESFSSLSISVVGDLIVDEYIDCDALGMSREDPTIVVSPRNIGRYVGGAGIVAAHGHSLGAKTRFITIAGDDEAAEFSKYKLGLFHVPSQLVTDDTRPTPLKRRFRCDGKTLLRVNELRQHDPPPSVSNKIIRAAIESLDQSDVLIFSDFNYGCLTDNLVSRLSDHARKSKVFCAADSQSSSQIGNISRFRGMNLLCPTEYEARLSMADQRAGLSALGIKLMKTAEADSIILKLGRAGVLMIPQNALAHELKSVEAFNPAPEDVAGAGDSLLIASTLALACGASLTQATIIGSLAAGIQTSRIGNTPIDQDDLLAVIDLYFH
jgi:rfaE bifunctional protein kinase chain/domain